jgi:hypothetical protein
MKRLLGLVAIASLAVLAALALSAGGAGKGGKQEQTLNVVERTNAISFIEAPPNGDSQGDYVVISSDLFDAHDRKIGTSHEVCFRVVPEQLRQCNLTYFFEQGFLVLQGPYRDDGTGTFAITGGTGAYRSASGWMDLLSTTTPDQGQTFEYVEVFHIIF